MMSKVDTGPLRQLYDHLGIVPAQALPSAVAWQLQERNPEESLPEALSTAIDELRDMAAISRDYLQIGALEFSIGLDFLHGGRSNEAIHYFETARRQWLFVDHLPLISLAHFGEGVAYHAAGQFRQAAAAYQKVEQCIHQAETEPYRMEKIEAERSFQAYWNDLERLLLLAKSALRRDLTKRQNDRLRAELGDIIGYAAEDSNHQD